MWKVSVTVLPPSISNSFFCDRENVNVSRLLKKWTLIHMKSFLFYIVVDDCKEQAIQDIVWKEDAFFFNEWKRNGYFMEGID